MDTDAEKQPIIASFEDFLVHLGIPSSCKLDKPIYKKMFLDANDANKSILNTTDKKALKQDIENIRWLYTLKPNTINISPYQDAEREYPEIAVLHIELARPNNISRINQFINRAIPYPLLILFSSGDNSQQSLAIGLADKRINRADKSKWVIETTLTTDWIMFSTLERHPEQREFLACLQIKNFPFTHLWCFYQSIQDCVIALKCAKFTGEYKLPNPNDSQNLNRLESYQTIEKLSADIALIANQLKKQKQMGKQIELNTQIKNKRDKISSLIQDL